MGILKMFIWLRRTQPADFIEIEPINNIKQFIDFDNDSITLFYKIYVKSSKGSSKKDTKNYRVLLLRVN